MKLEPEFNFHDATKFIIEKMVKFQTSMHRAYFRGNNAKIIYRSLFTSSVYYGIEAISLSPKQYKEMNRTWTVPWLHRLNYAQTTTTEVRHMLKEYAGLELFKIEDIMLIKKIKQLLGHLLMNDRIGVQIRSNLVHSQIYSVLDKSILHSTLFYKPYWTEKMTNQFKELGVIVHIKHWLPKPLITEEITIVQKSEEIYNDKIKVLKINEMCMFLNIVYLSEIGKDVEFHKHNIAFPKVEVTRDMKVMWNKFKSEVREEYDHKVYCGSISNVKW